MPELDTANMKNLISFHLLFCVENWTLVSALSFTSLSRGYLIQHNWMLCDQQWSSAKCAAAAQELFPNCRSRTMAYFEVHEENVDLSVDQYIVQGLCYNSEISASNSIMKAPVRTLCQIGFFLNRCYSVQSHRDNIR